ncbi:MAG: beta-ketoacyl-ACP synthase III [Vicinamibacterales bacterium]|nr:beta-ketoacyl-ACP synthase III [Vicinamibacterales bacterium]
MVNRKEVRPTRISALATYVPPTILDNKMLSDMVETSDDWILQRTGIRTRHVVDKGVATSDLAAEAARKAIAQRGIAPTAVDFVVVGTTTPDMMFPSTAALVQHKIGASGCWGFDLGAACSGFTFALATASQLVSTGTHDCALVVGADVMSSIVDYSDRTTCVLFGDGAGAVLVEPAVEDGLEILGFEHHIDGSGRDALKMPGGGSLHPASHDTVDKKMHFIKQDGQAVFKFAVRNTEEISRRVMDKHGISAQDVALFVSHQANRRIIQSAADRLGFTESQVMINIEDYGNTTAATIPLALDDAIAQGRLKKGDLVLLASVGAGFTVGSVLVRWAF